MATFNYKQLFSKRNLYFIASFIVLVFATIALLFLLKDQSADNMQAKLIAQTSKGYMADADQLELVKRSLRDEVNLLPDPDEVINPEENITEVTRYLDNVFSDFRGEFVNSTLNFSELKEESGLAYTEAVLNITSTRSNFFEFLSFIESTGFSRDGANRLMEIRSININLNTSDEEDSITYRVTMRIYFNESKQDDTSTIEESESSAGSGFSSLFN